MTIRPLLLGMGWDRPGGLNRYVRDLYDSLQAGGWDSGALVLGPATDAPAGVRVVADEDASLPVRLCAFAKAARHDVGDFDLVDLHFALFGWWPVHFGALRRAPLVVHFHGPWSGESAVGQSSTGRSISAKRRVERSVYRRADRVVVLSQSFARLLVDEYAVGPWRVRVVPPGVDLERFSPDRIAARDRLGLSPDERLVFSARRLVARMGLGTLLEAWSGLARPGERLLLAVAGEGPLRDALEDDVRRLGLSSSVRLLGRVDEASLVDHYRAADLTVLPTLALEGFGLAVVEALACGTPVVVTDVGGLPEVVCDLDPTLVVPSDNVDALRIRLRSGLDGDVPSAAACRAHAETFDWRRSAAANATVYDEAISERSDSLFPGVSVGSERPLRVVFLDHCSQMSGAEIALARLLEALTDVDAHVILAEPGPLVNRLRAGGTSVVVRSLAEGARDLSRDRVRPGRLPWRPALALARYVLRLSAELRRLQPDVVHTNSLKAALYGSLAGRLAGVPVVWHARDRIEDDYLPAAAARLVRAAAAVLPHAVIANSMASAQSLRLRHTPVDVIGDPYLAPDRCISPRVERPDGLVVGMVGRLAPWKGQHVFLEAFARARPDGPDRAVLLGSAMFGEQVYAESLHRLVLDLGLEGRVELRGFVPDVEAELATFDVLVHASVTPEPFGQVLVEGMAAGVPVVASGAGGAKEIVTDGVDGLLHKPGDVASLTQVLDRVLSDAPLRQRLAEAGQRRARDFEPLLIGPRVVAVYRRVLADRPTDRVRPSRLR